MKPGDVRVQRDVWGRGVYLLLQVKVEHRGDRAWTMLVLESDPSIDCSEGFLDQSHEDWLEEWTVRFDV